MSQHLAAESVQVEMKRCSKCKAEKPITEFNKDRSRSSGLTYYCKACQIVSAMSWQRRNQERVAENRRCWEARNPDYIRSWVAKNQDKVSAARKRSKAKPDWRERRAVVLRNWRTRNPEAIIENSHRRRARLSGGGGSYTKEEIRALYARQEGRCANKHCRVKLGRCYHRDHTVPIAAGGSNYITNIQLLCGLCNTMKGARPMAWLLKRTEGRING